MSEFNAEFVGVDHLSNLTSEDSLVSAHSDALPNDIVKKFAAQNIAFATLDELKNSTQDVSSNATVIRAEDFVFEKRIQHKADYGSTLLDLLVARLGELDKEFSFEEERKVFSTIHEILQTLRAYQKTLSLEEDLKFKKRFQEKTHELISQSELCQHIYNKPSGYSGDFKTMEMIWLGRTQTIEHRYRGRTQVGKNINAFTLDEENCVANEERVKRLITHFERMPHKSIASIGCGSSIELDMALLIGKMPSKEIHLFDQDPAALNLSQNKLSKYNVQVSCYHGNILRSILSHTISVDFIYSTGLFDYFNLSSTSKIVGRLWECVNPGGELLVTNANPDNTSRFWMEYGGEWYLEYKTLNEMLKIGEKLQGLKNIRLETDRQNVYQYLYFQKK